MSERDAIEVYQRALVTLAFAEDDAPLPALAEFRVYRELIRSRLFGMARNAFARCFAWDARALDASFARYLSDVPPESPLIREVIEGFSTFALGDEALARAAPSWLPSMLRFEAAKWRVSSLEDVAVDGLHELGFEGEPVFNGTLVAVPLSHDVTAAEGAPRADPHTLLVYRRGGDVRVNWSRLPLVAALFAEPAGTLGGRVARVFEARGEAIDEAALGALATELTTAVERGILLGVRGPS